MDARREHLTVEKSELKFADWICISGQELLWPTPLYLRERARERKIAADLFLSSALSSSLHFCTYYILSLYACVRARVRVRVSFFSFKHTHTLSNIDSEIEVYQKKSHLKVDEKCSLCRRTRGCFTEEIR